MTVAQLIKKLQNFDPDMPVVVRTPSKNFQDDFGDLNASDIAVVSTAKVFNDPYWGQQIYDAAFNGPNEKNIKVLSLSGPSTFEKVRNGR